MNILQKGIDMRFLEAEVTGGESWFGGGKPKEKTLPVKTQHACYDISHVKWYVYLKEYIRTNS